MSDYRTWVKIPLFLSSYFPLWLIFFGSLFLDPRYGILEKPIKENPIVIGAAIAFGTIMATSIIVVLLILYDTRKQNNTRPIVVKERHDMTGEYILYAVTYIIPFLVNDFLEYSRIFALVVMMTTVGALYIRANLFHINPVLNLFQYKLYKISDYDNNNYIILSRRGAIQKQDTLYANKMNNNIYLDIEH